MKFETHVHQLFDAIRNCTIGAGFNQETHASWVRTLNVDLPNMRNAPIFVLRDYAQDILSKEMMNAVFDPTPNERVRLPTPTVIMEFRVKAADGDERWIVYSRQNEDHIAAILCCKMVDSSRTWTVHPYVTKLYPTGKKRVEVGTIFDGDQMIGDSEGYDVKALRVDCITAISVVCAVILLMTMPATVVHAETVTVPKEVNRGRSLLKRSRIPNHTILTLPRVVCASLDDDGPHGTHASPKTHWRRPHERRYPSGKVVRIDRILVNAKPGESLPPPPVTEIVLRP